MITDNCILVIALGFAALMGIVTWFLNIITKLGDEIIDDVIKGEENDENE